MISASLSLSLSLYSVMQRVSMQVWHEIPTRFLPSPNMAMAHQVMQHGHEGDRGWPRVWTTGYGRKATLYLPYRRCFALARRPLTF